MVMELFLQVMEIYWLNSWQQSALDQYAYLNFNTNLKLNYTEDNAKQPYHDLIWEDLYYV